MNDESGAGLRVDRWLWFTRFFKTRTLAARAVAGGHVRVNGDRPRPGHRVSPGDRIDLVRDRLPYALTVVALPSRRGPATEARTCYVEDDDAQRRRRSIRDSQRSDGLQMPRTAGRPDKRTRRKLRERNRGD